MIYAGGQPAVDVHFEALLKPQDLTLVFGPLLGDPSRAGIRHIMLILAMACSQVH